MEPSQNPLIDAVTDGDLMRMHAILDAGVDPNQLMVTSGGWIVDEAGRLVSSETEDSPLVAALRNTNFDAMKALLERGADANLTPEGAEPPLVMAASSGRPAFVQVLLEYGAELERTGASGRTALLWAVRMNRVACAVYLYKAGAEQGALAIEWANALGFEKLSAALAVLAPESVSETVGGVDDLPPDPFANPRRFAREP